MKLRRLLLRCWFILSATLLVANGYAGNTSPANAAKPDGASRFQSADGWLDISEFLDQTYGFVPLFIPITEPAVGLGGRARSSSSTSRKTQRKPALAGRISQPLECWVPITAPEVRLPATCATGSTTG